MNRLWTVLCLSLSVVAIGLAVFALFQSEPGGARMEVTNGDGLRELQSTVDLLRERVEELESKQDMSDNRVRFSPGKRRLKTRGPSRVEPADLQEQVAELKQRLASLEDDETIARLAQSGEEQVVRRELNGALDRIGDPEADPEERLEALGNVRRLEKQHWPLFARAMKESELTERDIVLPLVELAQDTTLEPELRAEAVRNLHSKVPELRQPLLDLLAFDASPEVREGTIDALMYHLGDAAVRRVITEASQGDRHEGVRTRALRYLPKVQHFDRMAAEAERAAADRATASGEGK